MLILSEVQENIIDAIDGGTVSRWRDWKWQVKHCIRDPQTFEELLNIHLTDKQRRQINATINKFPMSITPYYLSLINTEDLSNDPIFRQSFPNPSELNIGSHDMTDPLHEDKDSPVPGSPTGILTAYCFL